MASDTETIADIEAEMRAYDPSSEGDALRMFADRLKAARRRENEAWKTLHEVSVQMLEQTRAESDRRVEDVVKHGNAAAMREALKVIRGMVNEELEDLKDISDEVRADFISIRGWCDHALSAPPRECDAFTDHFQCESLRRAFVKHCNDCDCPMGCLYRRQLKVDVKDADILGCFARFALSRKGEDDGGK